MDGRVTPPKRVASPTWGPPPPRKQALNPDDTACRVYEPCGTGFLSPSTFTTPRLTEIHGECQYN